MSDKSHYATLGFTIRWIAACVGGLFLGSCVDVSLPFLRPERSVIAMLPLGLGLGLTLGALQALVIRRYLDLPWVWAVATGFGVVVSESVAGSVLHDTMGLVFGFYVSPLPEALAALSIVGVTIGVCVGGAQWIVLYGSGYRALLWIPLSIVGFTAAIGIGDFAAVPGPIYSYLPRLLGGFILGCGIYGLLTGLLLSRIFRRNSAPHP